MLMGVRVPSPCAVTPAYWLFGERPVLSLHIGIAFTFSCSWPRTRAGRLAFPPRAARLGPISRILR